MRDTLLERRLVPTDVEASMRQIADRVFVGLTFLAVTWFLVGRRDEPTEKAIAVLLLLAVGYCTWIVAGRQWRRFSGSVQAFLALSVAAILFQLLSNLSGDRLRLTAGPGQVAPQ